MLTLILVLLGTQATWLEARTPTVDKMLDEFTADYFTARDRVAPGTFVVVEYPEAELYIGQQRAIAYTTWQDGHMLMKADWRALYTLEPPVRTHVAIHEACHLRQIGYIRRETGLSAEERNILEMDAERCVVLYNAMGSQ